MRRRNCETSFARRWSAPTKLGELNDMVIAALEGETEAVFERVRKRLPPKCS